MAHFFRRTLTCTGFSFGMILLPLCVTAQRYSGAEADKIFKGSTLVVMGDESKIPTMVLMGEQTDYKAKAFPGILQPVFKLREDDFLKESKLSRDYIGFTHHHYDQYYKNIKVEGPEYLMHEKLGRIISVNGLLLDSIEVNTTPKILPKAAIEAAQNDLKAKKYKWENPAEEARLRKMKKDSAATYFPEPELVIFCKNLHAKKKEYQLCFKFDLYADEPMSRHWYFVDAHTGAVVAKEDRINTAHAQSAGTNQETNTGIRPNTSPANTPSDNTGVKAPPPSDLPK